MVVFSNQPMSIDDICAECGFVIVAHDKRMVGEVMEYVGHKLKYRRKVLCEDCASTYFLQSDNKLNEVYNGKESQETSAAGVGESDDTGVYVPKDGEWNPAEAVGETSRRALPPPRRPGDRTFYC